MSDDTQKLILSTINDAPTIVGSQFRGSWFAVEADKLAIFDEATYSNLNVHEVDEASYPESIVEGFHLLALLDHLVDEVVSVDGDAPWYALNYGLDKVRFVTSVQAGDPIRVTGTVVSATPKNGGFLVKMSCEVELRGAPRPAFIAETLVLWLPANS